MFFSVSKDCKILTSSPKSKIAKDVPFTNVLTSPAIEGHSTDIPGTFHSTALQCTFLSSYLRALNKIEKLMLPLVLGVWSYVFVCNISHCCFTLFVATLKFPGTISLNFFSNLSSNALDTTFVYVSKSSTNCLSAFLRTEFHFSRNSSEIVWIPGF